MTSLARLVVGHARAVVLVSVAAVLAAAVWGSGAIDRLTTGGNEVPGSESVVAAGLLAEDDVAGVPNVVVLVPAGDAAEETTAGVVDVFAAEGIALVGTGFGPDAAAEFVAGDGSSGLVVGTIPGGDAEVQSRAGDLVESLDGFDVTVGGTGPARAELIERTEDDLDRAELIALPLTVAILLFVFRTPLAAAMPLVVALVAMTGTLAALRTILLFTEVSVFARNVMTAIGLAMAVDVTLFLVGRYREERQQAGDVRTAVHLAVVRAGPSILFSGLTTAASLAGLLAFSTPILRSFAYGGVAVVLLALVGGLVVLPAVMVLLGDRLDRWAVRRPAPLHDLADGRWYRLARAVMRRPLLIAVATTAVLVWVALPITRIDLGLNDDRVLPTEAEARQVLDTIRADYPGLEGGDVSVVFVEAAPSPTATAAYADAIAEVAGVARVDVLDGSLRVVPAVEPISAEGRALVEDIRATPAPVEVVVGGEAARLVDNTDHVAERLPLVLAVVLGVTAILLFTLFRSVVVTIKAIVLNLLSLSVMFGAIVWVFQDGRFADLLGYTPTGLTDVTVPALMFGVAFGLSMDYEVFLLSRIRGEYRRSGSTEESVARGLQRTGGILSTSAILIAVVFLAFSTGSVAQLKVLGIGVALAVLVDAFIVRSLLVPSLMALAGRWNWWPGIRERAARDVPLDDVIREELDSPQPVG